VGLGESWGGNVEISAAEIRVITTVVVSGRSFQRHAGLRYCVEELEGMEAGSRVGCVWNPLRLSTVNQPIYLPQNLLQLYTVVINS